MVHQSIRTRGRWMLAAGLLVALAVMPAGVAAQGATAQLQATLSGANEVPPTTSTATGTFAATLDESTGTMNWTLSVPSMQNIRLLTCTWCGGLKWRHSVNLYVPPAGTAPVNMLNLSGTARAADLVGSLSGNVVGFVTQLRVGTIYANVHTTANPGGEIRAQVTVTSAQGARRRRRPRRRQRRRPLRRRRRLVTRPYEPGTAMGFVVVLALLATAVVAGGRLLGSRSRVR